MRRYGLFLATTAAAFMGGALTFGPGGAAAQECPGVSQTQCEEFCAAEGTTVASCTKTGPTPDCVCTETTKDVNGNAFGTATQESAEGQGNLGNKTEPQPCEGNVGQCKKQ